ncbi:MAG: GTPase HflX, partial [Candidatus Kapabacteria bacterium]|nr:GTPase HflX [Candidatus Kapabacteria bacterium]MDW8225291.1 GTPase HflX [Bacteroidota bacterium]
MPNRALLIGLLHRQVTRPQLHDHLQELEALVHSAGAEVIATYWQERSKPDVATLIGRGKVEELHRFIQEQGISMVVFDEELTPVQARNLERAWNVKVLDRAGIIL